MKARILVGDIVANTGNVLDRPSDEELEQATGSRFILNNTSYSGADIKVVVHMYDSDTSISDQKSKVKKDLEKAEADLSLLDGRINEATQKLAAAKAGTPEFFFYSARLRGFAVDEQGLTNTIESLNQKLTQLNSGVSVTTTKVLAEVQTLSLSVFRDKQAVRSMGSVYPKGFTRDQREIAGTLVFTVFDEHVLYNFLNAHLADFDHSSGITSALMDQLPPVDITVAFANEFGSVSRMSILGVEFVDEGQTMSIEDLITENVVSFVARDFDPMRSVKQRKIDENSRLVQEYSAKRASDLILEEDFQKSKDMLNPFTRFRRRRNPFL